MSSLVDAPAFELSSRFRAELPELVVDWQAGPATEPRLVVFNDPLAAEVGLAGLRHAGVGVLTGHEIVPGSHPVAMAYAGHQFGSYAPLLGDGRALLLGELATADGLVDLHLKGSGRTPFARGGDGRAALGPMLREFLIAEAMHALGIPTTRALAVVTTGDRIHRAGDDIGAVLVRVASSHLRVGMFEYAARLPDPTVLQRLADHAIERHHPGARDAEVPALALLDAVVGAQASLIADWMSVGFIHGVMNTDNTTISGETIDYGPCAFMDRYDPDTVYSSIDHAGRYRYGNQPAIAEWNLTRLAEALLPLIRTHDGSDDDAAGAAAATEAAIRSAQEVLRSFAPRYAAARHERLRRKLGLLTDHDGDGGLFDELFEAMRADRADLTLTFRALADDLRGPDRSDPVGGGAVEDGDVGGGDTGGGARIGDAVAAWIPRWRTRLHVEGRPTDAVAAAMDDVNPLYIPRNHLVEEALAAAAHGDLGPFGRLLAVVTSPFERRDDLDRFELPAPDDFARGYQTFCGT